MSIAADWIAVVKKFLVDAQGTSARQFWLNWGVQVAVAWFTFLAVAAALFVSLWPKIFRPRFRLTLRDPDGEKTYTTPKGSTIPVPLEDVRYYHLRISNIRRRWSPATEVRVHVIRIEEIDPAPFVWQGDVPLRWRDEEGLPSIWQTVGPVFDCDLCSVGAVNGFHLQLRYLPNNLIAHNFKRAKFTWDVELQARSIEADSAVLRFRISWDGVWDEDSMQDHLKITGLS